LRAVRRWDSKAAGSGLGTGGGFFLDSNPAKRSSLQESLYFLRRVLKASGTPKLILINFSDGVYFSKGSIPFPKLHSMQAVIRLLSSSVPPLDRAIL